MTVSNSDDSAKPDRIAADGHVALRLGDTIRASACYREAGEMIEASIANERKPSEKQLLRFLAASQYYHGGHYEKALALGQKIEGRRLPGNVRHLLPQFMKDATERAQPEYAPRVREKLGKLWERGGYQQVIELLQDHPYVMAPGAMATLRAMCCERLKDYRAAAIFFGDALRMRSDDPQVIFLAAGYAFTLIHDRKFAEASEYVEQQLKEFPHAITFANASLLRSSQTAAARSAAERQRLLTEQLDYFKKATDRFAGLPEQHRAIQEFRVFMTVCAVAAAFALLRSGQRERALEVYKRAAAFNPSWSGLTKLRKIITSTDRSIEDAVDKYLKEQERRIAELRQALGGKALIAA